MDLYDMYADKATKVGVPEDKRFLWIEEKVREHTEREERALAREEKRREAELEKRRLESEEKKREMEFELKKLKLQSMSNAKSNATGTLNANMGKPRLPALNLATNQVDLYLERFERHCSSMGWPKQDWPSCLVNLLRVKRYFDRWVDLAKVVLCEFVLFVVRRVFPTAVIDLQSQYFSGRVEACVLENPIADVILGNIAGIKSLYMDSAVANPVKTRAQDKNHPDAGSNACSNDNVENINLF
ncbi:hypothetical protein ElyMa_001572600 [Elysia marginata]|uniref:Uncharacterized protein n=1 Tax=Elysia marginata TaxID=1093978 RepID=A0AAV4JGJ3_9GAST|nr:hypothetical protein ElyMa_001572600 [Elysia marginata]